MLRPNDRLGESSEEPTGYPSGGEPLRRRGREASGGTGSEILSEESDAAEGGGALGGLGEGQKREPWEESATSGLGFMSALQRALTQHQWEGHEGDGKGGRTDRHALELLSTIAACCEVRQIQDLVPWFIDRLFWFMSGPFKF